MGALELKFTYTCMKGSQILKNSPQMCVIKCKGRHKAQKVHLGGGLGGGLLYHFITLTTA